MIYRNRDLLDCAYLLDCQARIPGICTGGQGEPMHSNQKAHGQGMGIKAADVFFASGCRTCHQAIDHGHPSLSADERAHYWRLAADRTLLQLFALGHIVVVTTIRDQQEASNDSKPPKVRGQKSKGRTASPSKIAHQKAALAAMEQEKAA